MSAKAPSADWVLPGRSAARKPNAVVQTGPSGLLLGTGSSGPVAIRLFGPRPIRLLVAVPEYVSWLLAFRCISLGAHISIVSQDASRWQGLLDTLRACGGTADLVRRGGVLPSQGRPYRPSLIIDDADHFDGAQAPLGHWQAVMTLEDAAAPGAVYALRSCDMALVSPCDAKVTENLRRAYVLDNRQVKLCANLDPNEVVLVMPRRIVRLPIPPTQSEYDLLFG